VAVRASPARNHADLGRALGRTGRTDPRPSWQLKGRDWGNLAAGYPCLILPPGHPRLAALADRVWAAAGGAGLTWYGTPDSLHYYLGADLGTWALLAGPAPPGPHRPRRPPPPPPGARGGGGAVPPGRRGSAGVSAAR